MPTLKQLFGTPCEPSELANYGANSGLQADFHKLRTCELSELGCSDTHPSSHGSQSSQTTKTGYSPMNAGMFASSQSSQGYISESEAANEDESEESLIFWSNLIDRIHWCDFLIHTLCDVRGDDQARRGDLIRTRQRTSAANVDSDIRYLLAEIETVMPTSLPEPKRDCRDCDHHRGRNNNSVRYCVSPDGPAQRDDALASPIVDCSIATRCRAFKK
jgi:hypothetical protein